MAEVDTVQRRPCMPRKLYEAAIEGDEQILIEMLGLEKEDSGESDTGSLAQSERVKNLQSATFMGNTILHVLCAFNHDVLASKVCKKDGALLRARNKLLETPLHYAAKGIVSEKAMQALLDFARSEGELILKGLLQDRNCHGETALHVAVTYYEMTITTLVETMIEGDSEWADQPAILHSNLSSAEIAQELTKISTSAGTMGSHPIHIATSSLGTMPIKIIMIMLEKDPSVAYLQDSDGLFPVHIAARMGNEGLLLLLMRRHPDCGELVDHHERNFLHIAAEKNRWRIFSRLLENSCKDSDISPFWDNIIKRMMYTPDKKGNTPMHIASEKGNRLVMKIIYDWGWKFTELCGNNVRNRKGLSAFDISMIEAETRAKNSAEIEYSIAVYREDFRAPTFSDDWFDNIMPTAEGNDSSMMGQLQIIGLGAVLITTVAFAAAFTLPGGYNSNGSPLLAGKYLFKAFILAITSAFLQSFFCVLTLMIGGLSSRDRLAKSVFLSIAMYLLSGGARSMVLSFGLGLYLVLAPVHKGVSILILLLAFGSVMLDITPSFLRFIIKAINWIGDQVNWIDTKFHILDWDVIDPQFHVVVTFLGVLRFIMPFVFIFILALLP